VQARLNVFYRGVPIGITTLLEHRLSEPAIEGISGRESPPPGDREARIDLVGFEPLPGYDSIASIIQRAADSDRALGYLGTAADPESKAAADDAWAAREALCAELELYDEEGHRVPARIGMLNEWRQNGQRRFDILGSVAESAAARRALPGSP